MARTAEEKAQMYSAMLGSVSVITNVLDASNEFCNDLTDAEKKARVMRSEGYSTEKARNNGMESVNKNKTLKERWSVGEQMKRFFLSLKAGNHQEIAKSGAYNSKAEAEGALAAYMSGKSVGGSSMAASGSSAGASSKSTGSTT